MTDKTYWIVEGEDEKAFCKKALASYKPYIEHAKAMIAKYGATDARGQFSIEGMDFEKKPNQHWKKLMAQTFVPRATVEGRKILEDLLSVKAVSADEIGDRLLGTDYAIVGCHICKCGLSRVRDEYLVVATKSDWWKPVAGLREIKASEYYAKLESK